LLSFGVALLLCISGSVQATTELEEILVVGTDLSERKLFQVALSSVVLVHEYNKEKDVWEFVKAKDTSKSKEEEESK
jgi:hypothetical protein